MRLYKQILYDNDCYRAGRTIRPKGVMVHSTGANNPSLARYVAPDDGRLGSSSGRHWNQSGVGACVHAFIGRLADGSVATYQTLPWECRGWHCAGKANDTHISFEICEDGLKDPAYFAAVYREAVELTAYLCGLYKLDPEAPGVVICHAEGHRLGLASNHADVLHWFPRFGKDMDTFRADVARELRGEDDSMTYEQFEAYMDRYRRERGKMDATMPDLLADAQSLGITDGSRPRDFATREECAVMVRKMMRDTHDADAQAPPVVTENDDMTTIKCPAGRFRLVYEDKPKRELGPDSCNANFFAAFNTKLYTLPVGHLVCDFAASDPDTVASCRDRGTFKDSRFRFDSGSFEYQNHLYGHAQATLVVKDGRASVQRLEHAPSLEEADYAVSGIHLIQDGQYVTLYDIKARQGWLGSELRPTSHIFVGIKKDDPGHIYIIGMETRLRPDMVTSSEAYNRLRPYGYDDVIKLDGGGSYMVALPDGRKLTTGGNRRICAAIRF